MDLSKKTTTMTLLISLVFFFFIVSGDPLLAQTPGETELHKLKAPVDVDAKGIDNEPRIPGEWKLPEASPQLLREGYSVAKGPIDGTNGLNIVAGCVPKDTPIPIKDGFSGSFWVACNDINFLKDKVEVTDVTTCLDAYPNGVLEGLFIKEVNNRTWESFRISCRKLLKDGTLGAERVKLPFLFNFEKDGQLHYTIIDENKLAFGFLEIQNQLHIKEGLLQVALINQTAAEIWNAGQAGRSVANEQVTKRVPPAKPLLVKTFTWNCPPGTILTGAGIGHIPNKKGKHTRPIFILGECRVLHHSARPQNG